MISDRLLKPLSSVLMHTKGGEIIIRMLPTETDPGLELIALDRGPGIA